MIISIANYISWWSNHLTLGMQTALAPGAGGTGLELGNLAALAIWALVGIRIAGRRFRWEPQSAGA